MADEIISSLFLTRLGEDLEGSRELLILFWVDEEERDRIWL